LNFLKPKTEDEINNLAAAEGFTQYVVFRGNNEKADLKESLRKKILDGDQILLVLKEKIIIGFAIITDWQDMPDAKCLEIIEIAEPYRCMGMGSILMEQILKEWGESLIILTAQTDPSHEEKLIKFYKKMGFKLLANQSFSAPMMAYIPPNKDKLNAWINHIEKSFKEYSYKQFDVQKALPTWGRRYAPWLNYSYDVYNALLIEMQHIIEEGMK